MRTAIIVIRKIIITTILLTGQKCAFALPFLSVDRFLKRDTIAVKDSLWLDCAGISSLPPVFQKGYVMLYRREVPGIIEMIDVKGNIVWSYQSKDAGFKVVRFTKNHTLLCITGTKENDIGYGNAIVELSLQGDTLLYLQEGQQDFNQSIHHEILLNSKNEIVTLCNEERIYDLRSKGGSEKDTVRGDGIVVMDKLGRQVWKWTVFDALDPLHDKNILQNKKDWMHANSIALDKDGNYLVSFYNSGQVWKVSADKTRNVIWKFGKNGDFEIPATAVFGQSHAVHINSRGWLMLFDNGADKKRSRTMAFRLDRVSKKAQPVINAWLPPSLYSERMGSSYLVGDTSLLVCSSRHKTVVLTNLKGDFLWKLCSNSIMSYRAEFIPGEILAPYLMTRSYHTKNK